MSFASKVIKSGSRQIIIEPASSVGSSMIQDDDDSMSDFEDQELDSSRNNEDFSIMPAEDKKIREIVSADPDTAVIVGITSSVDDHIMEMCFSLDVV